MINETEFNKTALMVLARNAVKRLFADMENTDFDELDGLTNLSFDDPNWAYNYFNLAVLSVATVLYGTGIALTLWVVSHVRSHIFVPCSAMDPEEDNPDHLKRFTKFLIFALIKILVLSSIDFWVSFDMILTHTLDWDQNILNIARFIEFCRICRECLIIALAINQIVSISIKGSVVRPWTNALTWLLLFCNIFWLPFLIMAIRYGYMHVIGGQDEWLLTLEKFQTTDLILGPSVVGLIVFVVLYVTASEQVKKGRLSQSATNTTKISLAFLSILLIRCAVIAVLDTLFYAALSRHWTSVLEMLRLPSLLLYPLTFMFFRTCRRQSLKLFTCLNGPNGLGYGQGPSLMERRQAVRMSESEIDVRPFHIIDPIGAQPLATNRQSNLEHFSLAEVEANEYYFDDDINEPLTQPLQR